MAFRPFLLAEGGRSSQSLLLLRCDIKACLLALPESPGENDDCYSNSGSYSPCLLVNVFQFALVIGHIRYDWWSCCKRFVSFFPDYGGGWYFLQSHSLTSRLEFPDFAAPSCHPDSLMYSTLLVDHKDKCIFLSWFLNNLLGKLFFFYNFFLNCA